MGQSYFIWKNIDCRAMGIRLSGPAAIIRPEERAQHVTIPGRSGDLTMLEGENIYNSYIQTVTIMAHGAARIRQIYDWLRGSGYVTFSGEPDKRQAARIIGAVTLNKHSYNLDWWEGEVQFYCQPLKEKLSDSNVVITESGAAVANSGDVKSRPKMQVTASADSFTITIGGETFTMNQSISGNRYIIDSETMTVIAISTGRDVTFRSSGEFPMLGTGSNTITGSGWSKIEIERRERFL